MRTYRMLLVAMLAACSPDTATDIEDGAKDAGTGPRNAATGTVGGVTLDVRDARMYGGQDQFPSGGIVTVPVIELSTAAALCPQDRFALTKNAVTLRLGLVKSITGNEVDSLEPGSYAIDDTDCMDARNCRYVATAMAARWDAACSGGHPAGGDGSPLMASSGTVTVETLQNGTVTGSFDLLFDAERLTGTFVAPTCADTTIDASTCRDP